MHNQVIPVHPLGLNGFRAWRQDFDAERLTVCDCDWAPSLERHYPVTLTVAKSSGTWECPSLSAHSSAALWPLAGTAGRIRSASFDTYDDAEVWCLEQLTARVPRNSTEQLPDHVQGYATEWAAAQPVGRGTRDRVGVSLNRHLFPSLGAERIAGLRPTRLQAVITGAERPTRPEHGQADLSAPQPGAQRRSRRRHPSR